MWKIVTLIGILCFVAHDTFGEEFNDLSRYQFGGDVSQIIGPKYLDRNVILSPVSLHSVLSLAYMGAKGQTADDLAKGLHLPPNLNKDALAKEYGNFLNYLRKDGGKIQMANRIYLNMKYKVANKFNEYATGNFESGLKKVNFANANNAASEINSWVEEKTNNKIRNLISPLTLSPETAAFLINAVYFKADWENKFQKTLTTNKNFNLNNRERVSVPTMKSNSIYIKYCESPEMDLKAVELPYKDTKITMLILLPNKVDGLSYLQSKATPQNLQKLAQSCKAQSVVVTLPKFKIETEVNLPEHLKNMGMGNIFTSRADFSEMLSKSEPLVISDAKQKAYINVDESGSEAAAVTFVQIGSTSMSGVFSPVPPVEFTVDHPFAFAIKDDHALYFVGHVIKP